METNADLAGIDLEEKWNRQCWKLLTIDTAAVTKSIVDLFKLFDTILQMTLKMEFKNSVSDRKFGRSVKINWLEFAVFQVAF